MDNRGILNTALAQSAVDYGCSPGDFLRSEPTVVLSQKREGARCYLPLPLTCSLVSYGGCVVAQTSEPLLAPVREFLLRYPAEHCFETPNLYELNRIRTPYALSSAQKQNASARFLRASVSREYTERCEPVSTTGFALFCTRYESAAAVYAIVSVPCVTTKPSYSA